MIPLLQKLYQRATVLFAGIAGGPASRDEPIVATFARELVDLWNNTVLTIAQAKQLAAYLTADAFPSTGGYAPFSRETANFTAVVGGTYGVDTTAASVTVTPPAAPNDGDWFRVFDVAKKWGTNQAVIGTSSNNFIDQANPTATAGPYDLTEVPYSGQGFITFVWDAALNVWSVN